MGSEAGAGGKAMERVDAQDRQGHRQRMRVPARRQSSGHPP